MGPHMLSRKPKGVPDAVSESCLPSGGGPMPAEAMVLTSFRAEVLANAVAARAASEALLTSFFVSVIL